MILTICPYYKTGRKCTNEDYCCEKTGNTCMSDTYYAMDLKAENKHLNDLLNQALKEKELAEQKLEKIKEIANSRYLACGDVCAEIRESGDCSGDGCNAFKLFTILQIIEKET